MLSSPSQAAAIPSAGLANAAAAVDLATDVRAGRGGARGGAAVHRGGAVAVRRGGAVAVGRHGAVGVRRGAAVGAVGVAGVRHWARRPYYGRVVGGVALGTILTAAAIGIAPAAPASNLCWYWTDPSQTRGYWDYCQ
jgi:hypothetical protein